MPKLPPTDDAWEIEYFQQQKRATPEWQAKEAARVAKIELERRLRVFLPFFDEAMKDVSMGFCDFFSITTFVNSHLPQTNTFNDDVEFFTKVAINAGLEISHLHDIETGETIVRMSKKGRELGHQQIPGRSRFGW